MISKVGGGGQEAKRRAGQGSAEVQGWEMEPRS